MTPCDVIEHDDGSLVGIDRLQGETFDVIRNDVVIYRMQIRELSRFLMELLGGEIEFETESIGSPHHRLGRLSRRFKSTLVHLCTRNDRTSLLSVADTLRPTKPLLLFVPTLTGTDADIDSLDEHHRVVVFGLDKLVVKSGDSIIVNRDAMEDLRCRLGLGDDLDSNFFRRNGSGYDICFEGKRFPLTDAVGLWYLAEFLAKPGDTLDPVELEAARTGINARSATSGTGESLDAEALTDYKRQLLELSEDIVIAERNRDVGTLERLQTERHQIAELLQKDIGLHGKSRVKTDAGNSRKNVRQQLQREIERIRKPHPALAEHLSASFHGHWMSYQPADDPQWEF